jgi:putative ABC transport system substrate-binding protein
MNRNLWLLLVVLLTSFNLAEAQQPTKIPRIGYVSGTGDATHQGPYVEALRQGLRQLGYVEGKNFAIEYRGAAGNVERVSNLVNELVEQKVDVLIAPIPGAIRAAKEATKTIPIVMVASIDPVATGLVESLAHPGGNITGISTLSLDLNGKRIELLKEAVPRLSRVAVLLDIESESSIMNLKEYETASRPLKIQIQSIEVRGIKPDLEKAFQTATKARVGAIITITNANLFLQQKRLADLAIKTKLPSMYQGSTWVEVGGLMSYSTDELGAFRRAATFIDKILKGTKPADIPVEQQTKFEFVINLKTAKQIGLTIPQKVLIRADKVIK